MRCFKMSCLVTTALLALPILIWAIGGSTTAHGEESAARQAAKQSTTQAAKPLDGISKLLLVCGKSRAEALQMALGSGAKEVLISLGNVDTKTASGIPVQFETVKYRIINGRVVETELSIDLSRGQKSIKGVSDEVVASARPTPAPHADVQTPERGCRGDRDCGDCPLEYRIKTKAYQSRTSGYRRTAGAAAEPQNVRKALLWQR